MTTDHTADWKDMVSRHAPKEGINQTSFAPLLLARISGRTLRECFIQKPALTLIVQGRKEVKVGREILQYDEAKYCVVSLDMPLSARILREPDAPLTWV